MRNLIIGVGRGYNEDLGAQLCAIRRVGWDGVFTGWDENNGLVEHARLIREQGLQYHSVHAPFNRIECIWEGSPQGDDEVQRLIRCISDCADVGVPLVVMHAIKGMDKCTPSPIGIERFAKILAAAERCKVNVALENTEGEVYLESIFKELGDSKSLRFCIDTGHEMCYNFSADLITKYGNYLISTHLNDNLGITGEGITWLDDAHLMPFDGVADWQGIADRLAAVNYKGELTFELTRKNKPGRTVNDRYAELDLEGFLAAALERARRFRGMLELNT